MENGPSGAVCFSGAKEEIGAGEGIRTLDPNIGKSAHYRINRAF